MLEKKAESFLPTRFGDFKISVFASERENEYAVLVKGNIQSMERVPVRVHSGCLTGDVFFSLKCDCREQLEESLRMISGFGAGIIIYDRLQEGRGIGLSNKILSYSLQEKGLDTIEANHHLGLSADLRTYKTAAEILKQLGVKSVSLITNNPDKIEQLKNFGVNVAERIPISTIPNPFNQKYLETKRAKMGHYL